MAAQLPLDDSSQQQVLSFGKKIIAALATSQAEQADQQSWLDLLLKRTLSDTHFRLQALRFIDVLPSLDDDHSLAQHLQEYFSGIELPRFAEWGLRHSDTPWATRIAAPTVRYSLRGLARRFMGGSKLHHAMTCISRLRHQNMNFTLDLLGEATISENECQAYQQQYLELLEALSEPVNNWNHNSHLDINQGPASPRINLSIKLSSLYSQIDACAHQHSIQAICQKLRPVLRKAMEFNAFITIDMEQYDFKNIVLDCFRQIIMEEEFKNWPHIGIALQAYLKDTYEDIQSLLKLLEQRGTPVSIRLVRGAYWDYETVLAEQNNWPCPVWQNKNDTDHNYEHCLQLLLQNHQWVHTAIASHNPRSLAYAMSLIEQYHCQAHHYEFQMLFGMADSLKAVLIQLGYRLRVYVPFGETLPGMAYLVRRLLENSSGQSLIDSGFSSAPLTLDESHFAKPVPTASHLQLTKSNNTFKNMPLLRFTQATDSKSFAAALQNCEADLGKHYNLLINGKSISTTNTIQSFNPANPDQLIGTLSSAEHQHADQALKAACDAFTQWRQSSARARADYLRRVASLLEKRRLEFAALEVFEAGKNWREADADICEAIDFLRYYAEQAEKLFTPESHSISGEENHIVYRPRGICLVIPPWNFPMAILTGMLSAAVVTGNCCILKPSSLTPVIAAKFMECWQQVDLPPGVINFLPGPGKLVGEYLARQPEVHTIAFTGSVSVGSQLINTAAQIQINQHHVKKVIAEMGGKNAIIIDSDADLDDAIMGTLHSAFGFQGQKCSAASRVIVVGSIYQRFLSRLIEASQSLNIGNPQYAHHTMGPVIDKHAQDSINSAIHQARQFAHYHAIDIGDKLDQGYYIQPCIFTDVAPDSPLAQEEIFGPVLAVFKVDSFEDAISLANNTRYALTGGLYSRQPSHIEYAKQHFDVGNLYINRKTTGALVKIQPFGGHKMSGTGNKTGGQDYLKQFVNAVCVTENTLRRGFAPKASDSDTVN